MVAPILIWWLHLIFVFAGDWGLLTGTESLVERSIWNGLLWLRCANRNILLPLILRSFSPQGMGLRGYVLDMKWAFLGDKLVMFRRVCGTLFCSKKIETQKHYEKQDREDYPENLNLLHRKRSFALKNVRRKLMEIIL